MSTLIATVQYCNSYCFLELDVSIDLLETTNGNKKGGNNNQNPQLDKPMRSKLIALKTNDKIATNRNTSPVPKMLMAASYFFLE